MKGSGNRNPRDQGEELSWLLRVYSGCQGVRNGGTSPFFVRPQGPHLLLSLCVWVLSAELSTQGISEKMCRNIKKESLPTSQPLLFSPAPWKAPVQTESSCSSSVSLSHQAHAFLYSRDINPARSKTLAISFICSEPSALTNNIQQKAGDSTEHVFQIEQQR